MTRVSSLNQGKLSFAFPSSAGKYVYETSTTLKTNLIVFTFPFICLHEILCILAIFLRILIFWWAKNLSCFFHISNLGPIWRLWRSFSTIWAVLLWMMVTWRVWVSWIPSKLLNPIFLLVSSCYIKILVFTKVQATWISVNGNVSAIYRIRCWIMVEL